MDFYPNCFISSNNAWKRYYTGTYVNKEEGKVTYNKENVLCSNSVFNGITTTIASLTGSSLALFHSCEFINCVMDAQKNVIDCSCYEIAFLMCFIKNFNAASTSNFLYLMPGFHYDAHVHLSSFSNCGDINKAHRCILTLGGMLETIEMNISDCHGSSCGNTMRIDETNRGTHHRFLKLSRNTCLNVVVSFEKPYNTVINSIMVDNGDEKTIALMYISQSANDFINCIFDRNTGNSDFFSLYYITNISFIKCYLQPKFGSKDNNALAYQSDPVGKESFNEFETYKCLQQDADYTSKKLTFHLLLSTLQLSLVGNRFFHK